MNLILSLIVSIMMGASLTPTNPIIAAFIEEANVQAQQSDEGTSATYEQTPLGYAVVIHQPVPVPSDMFSELPTAELKSEFMKGLESDPDTRDFLATLKKEKVNLILRFESTIDKGTLDLLFTPQDF